MIKKDEIILSCDDISKSYENGNSGTNVLKHVSIGMIWNLLTVYLFQRPYN